MKEVLSVNTYPSTETLRSEPIAFPFKDLEQFKQMLNTQDYGLHFQPYSMKKSSVLFYKLVFAGLGCLFLSLAYFTFSSMPRPLLLTDIEHAHAIHHWVSGFAFLTGLIGLGMSFTLKPERDALRCLFQSGKRKLARLYAERHAHVSIRKFLPFSDCYRHTLKIRNGYRHTLEKMEKQKGEMLLLLSHIACTPALSSSLRETLFNQALMEFHSKIEATIGAFERL